MKHIIYRLYSWKRNRKNFHIDISQNGNDFYGMYNNYHASFYCNNKKKASLIDTRLTSSLVTDNYISFCNQLQFHKEAYDIFREFHHSKIDILSLPVIFIS